MRLMPLVPCLLALASAASGAVLANDADISLRNPHASAFGEVVVVERVQMTVSGGCIAPGASDILVLDSRAGCGANAARLVTRDGASSDGTVTEDGTRIAWRTTPSPGSSRITVADKDGSNATILFNAAGTVTDLEISPNGQYVAFKLTGGAAGSGGQIRRITTATGTSVSIATASSPSELGLNRRRCVSSGGGVVFTRQQVGSLAHDVHVGNGSTVSQLTATAEDERFASFASVGSRIAFRRTSLVGVQNLFVGTSLGFSAVTTNASASVQMLDPSLTSFGHHVAFASNGNFTGGNADGSFEASSTGPVRQHGAHSPTLGFAMQVEQVDGLDRGELLEAVVMTESGMATWPVCDVTAANAQGIGVVTTMVALVAAVSAPQLRLQPGWDARFDGLLGLGCSESPAGSGSYSCTFLAVNPTEADREVLAWVTWPIPGSSRTSPHAFTLPADSERLVTLPFSSYGFQSGPVTIDLVSPDAGQPDVVRLTTAF